MAAEMRREGVQLHLSVVNGVGIEVVQQVEVSKQCRVCNKDDRTLIFLPPDEDGEGEGGRSGIATCRGKNHGDVGFIEEWSGDRRSASGGTFLYSLTFVITYPSTRHDMASTWARVVFLLTCPCGEQTRYACQNNISRPHPVKCEGCGELVATDSNKKNPRCVLYRM